MITGAVPNHLVVGARSGFLAGLGRKEYAWQRVTAQINAESKEQTLVDLGAAPMPKESASGLTVQDFIEKSIEVKAKSWDITVWISQDSMDDDQTGLLETRVRSAGERFQDHINKQIFASLNAGDGSTYGLAYDGQNMFSASHTDAGAVYTTAQNNVGALALSLDNFETTWAAAKLFVDDQGEYLNFDYDTIIVPPVLAREAANIVENPQDYGTANRAMNPFAGDFSYVVSPELDSTGWILAASNESHKPMILYMRKQPHLQSAWFDPDQKDGGYYFFKFYARYNQYYGDWRLAFLGNT